MWREIPGERILVLEFKGTGTEVQNSFKGLQKVKNGKEGPIKQITESEVKIAVTQDKKLFWKS